MHTGDTLGKILYASFLQKFMIIVKVGEPAVCRSLLRAAMSFGFQIFGFATLCILGVAHTSIAGLWRMLLIRSGGGDLVPEFVINSLGILLWRIEAFLERRSSFIVVNSHSMLTSPRENCLDCIRKIHRIDPFVDSIIRFIDSLEYLRSAQITSLSALKSGHLSGE